MTMSKIVVNFKSLLMIVTIGFLSQGCSNVEDHYSYYDAGGNKVIINLDKGGSGTIKMEYAKTSSGLEEYMSKEPIACSWNNYSSLGYLAIYSRLGDIYIKDGWAYFTQLDMKAKDRKRGCKLN